MVTAKKVVAKKAPAKKTPAAKKSGPVKTLLSKTVAKKAPAKKVAAKKVAARKPNAAFMKAMTPSPALAAVIGAMAVPRTEITSKLWAYIKKHNLQDPAAKRFINADAKLKEVFGKPRVDMFEMTRLVQSHLK
jgi:chromatin remodeling complex protein RSC6